MEREAPTGLLQCWKYIHVPAQYLTVVHVASLLDSVTQSIIRLVFMQNT